MLFDLRARGRRRVVKVVYASLALLMGGGLVLFGIGGDVQGGLVDAFREDSQQGAGNRAFEERLDKAEAAVKRNPQAAGAWAELARLRYQEAGQGENFDQAEAAFTESGVRELRSSVAAWERHTKLAKKPNSNVASLMVQAYTALDQLDKAVGALEIVVESRDEPTPQLYTQLASLAYAAGQTRKAELAGKQALRLANPDDREVIKGQLDSAKEIGKQRALQEAQQGQPKPKPEGAEGLLQPGS
ncbi:MAG TPA: hypothetical protein VD931_05045 [Baekduia sp.]|nr:hypothetical protein [Baekduia sp.]